MVELTMVVTLEEKQIVGLTGSVAVARNVQYVRIAVGGRQLDAGRLVHRAAPPATGSHRILCEDYATGLDRPFR
jgi:hypothetical protein